MLRRQGRVNVIQHGAGQSVDQLDQLCPRTIRLAARRPVFPVAGSSPARLGLCTGDQLVLHELPRRDLRLPLASADTRDVEVDIRPKIGTDEPKPSGRKILNYGSIEHNTGLVQVAGRRGRRYATNIAGTANNTRSLLERGTGGTVKRLGAMSPWIKPQHLNGTTDCQRHAAGMIRIASPFPIGLPPTDLERSDGRNRHLGSRA